MKPREMVEHEKIVSLFHTEMSSHELNQAYCQAKNCREDIVTSVTWDAHHKMGELTRDIKHIHTLVNELQHALAMPIWLYRSQVEAYVGVLMRAINDTMPGIASMTDLERKQELYDRIEVCKLPIISDVNYRRLHTLLRFFEKQHEEDIKLLEAKQIAPVQPIEKMGIGEIEKEIKERERVIYEISAVQMPDCERAALVPFHDACVRRLQALKRAQVLHSKQAAGPKPTKTCKPLKQLTDDELKAEMAKVVDDGYSYLELNTMRRRDIAHEQFVRKSRRCRPTIDEMTVPELDAELEALGRAAEANRKRQYDVRSRRSGILEGYDGVAEDHDRALRERFQREQRIEQRVCGDTAEADKMEAIARADELELSADDMAGMAASQQAETIRKDLYKAEVVETHVHTFTDQELEEWFRMATAGSLNDVLGVIMKEMKARERKAVEDLLYKNVDSPMAIKWIKEKLGL